MIPNVKFLNAFYTTILFPDKIYGCNRKLLTTRNVHWHFRKSSNVHFATIYRASCIQLQKFYWIFFRIGISLVLCYCECSVWCFAGIVHIFIVERKVTIQKLERKFMVSDFMIRIFIYRTFVKEIMCDEGVERNASLYSQNCMIIHCMSELRLF